VAPSEASWAQATLLSHRALRGSCSRAEPVALLRLVAHGRPALMVHAHALAFALVVITTAAGSGGGHDLNRYWVLRVFRIEVPGAVTPGRLARAHFYVDRFLTAPDDSIRPIVEPVDLQIRFRAMRVPSRTRPQAATAPVRAANNPDGRNDEPALFHGPVSITAFVTM